MTKRKSQRSKDRKVISHTMNQLLHTTQSGLIRDGEKNADDRRWREEQGSNGSRSQLLSCSPFWFSLPSPYTVTKITVTISWGNSIVNYYLFDFFIPFSLILVTFFFCRVTENANSSEIKKAYYKLSLKQ